MNDWTYMMRFSPQVRGWLMLIISNIWFAGAYVSGKWALTTLSPVTLNALRMLLASSIMIPLVVRGWKRVELKRGDLIAFILLSFCSFVLNKFFEYLGINLSTASDSALLISGESIFTVTLAWLLLHEEISLVRIGALALGICGVYLIIERGFMPHFATSGRIEQRILGDLLFLLSLTFEAFASITSKRFSGRISPLFVTAAAIVGSIFVWIPVGSVDIALHGLHITPIAAVGVIYLAAMTIGGYYLWFAGLQVVDGSAAAVTLFIQPLLGTVLAIVLLGDALSIFTVIGGIAIIASVWWLSRATTALSDVSGTMPLETP
jgi:drug/metabolite transporter (DMT)-like permease